jgi:WD40 repeat protein
VASFINTEGWPKYLIGTNKGKLYIVPTSSSGTIASFVYHKASVTCIFSTEDILVTASKDKTLCVWPLNVINEIERHHDLEETRARHKPPLQRIRSTSKFGHFGPTASHTDLEVDDTRAASDLVHIKPQNQFTVEEGFVNHICNV